MENLTKMELLTINGGGGRAPKVSSDSAVQGGYSVGWHIGHAIGNTIEDIGNILDHVNPFNW